jgi:hypothetical protein
VSEDAAFVWSLALSATNLAVFALTGRRSTRVRHVGWLAAIATEPLWAYYGYLTGGWAFVVLAAFYVLVAALNLRTLRVGKAES